LQRCISRFTPLLRIAGCSSYQEMRIDRYNADKNKNDPENLAFSIINNHYNDKYWICTNAFI